MLVFRPMRRKFHCPGRNEKWSRLFSTGPKLFVLSLSKCINSGPDLSMLGPLAMANFRSPMTKKSYFNPLKQAVTLCRLGFKCDGTRAESRIRLSTKRTSPFESAGASAEVCASAVVMLDTPCSEVVWLPQWVLATHCIRHFPLHFPSRASPCAITLQLDSTSWVSISSPSSWTCGSRPHI
jgi:hypothetical protein